MESPQKGIYTDKQLKMKKSYFTITMTENVKFTESHKWAYLWLETDSYSPKSA